MKQPITVRLDSELLATARVLAKAENRTLTNFLETALKRRFDELEFSRSANRSFGTKKLSRSRISKRLLNAKS